jgi:hypothetical protein
MILAIRATFKEILCKFKVGHVRVQPTHLDLVSCFRRSSRTSFFSTSIMRVSIEFCCRFACMLKDVTEGFRKAMPKLAQHITCVTRTQDLRNEIKEKPKDGTLVKMQVLNIAFSKDGLKTLSIRDDLGDEHFSSGQLADAQKLGDPGTVDPEGKFEPKWDEAFKHPIDGLILAATESDTTMEELLEEVESLLPSKGTSPNKIIDIVYTVEGKVRTPEANKVE